MFKNNGKLIIRGWIVFIALFYLIAGYIAASRIYQDQVSSDLRQQQRIDGNSQELGKTAVDRKELAKLDLTMANKVNVGIYVDRVDNLSSKNNAWHVDFYIWFNWSNGAIDPGETFQVIDGQITRKEKLKSSKTDNQRYALYRVTAKVSKFFNVVSYPLDRHLLTIQIEDTEKTIQELIYVADTQATDFSSRVKVPGYKLSNSSIIAKPHAYKTNRGDPTQVEGTQTIFSKLTYGIHIERPDLGLYFKMFQGLFASVAISMLAFILGVTAKERFGLGVGAFFASVGASYMNLNHLPGVGVVTLVDMANGLAMGTIFLTLLGSTISIRLGRDESNVTLAKSFNKISMALFISGYVSINFLMAFIALR